MGSIWSNAKLTLRYSGKMGAGESYKDDLLARSLEKETFHTRCVATSIPLIPLYAIYSFLFFFPFFKHILNQSKYVVSSKIVRYKKMFWTFKWHLFYQQQPIRWAQNIQIFYWQCTLENFICTNIDSPLSEKMSIRSFIRYFFFRMSRVCIQWIDQ